MPSVPRTEQEFWIERRARQIDQKLAALAAAAPGLRQRIGVQARQQALRSLGLAEMQAELDAVATQQQALQRRAQQARRAMLATVRRVPLEEVREASGGLSAEVTRAIAQRQAVHEDELLAADGLGQQILRLRREQEHLPDTVWLAAAPPPLVALWRQVLALLGEAPTPLQQEVLARGAAALA